MKIIAMKQRLRYLFLRKNVEKQKDDMEKILLQRLSEETVKEIMSLVRSKVKDTDVIEARYFL